MKKLTLFAGLLLIIGGAIYGVLYLDKTLVALPVDVKPMELPQVGVPTESKDENWFDFLPDSNELSYAYPATELSVRFDFLSPNSKRTIPSAISIDELDEYKFACVKQVLAENKIESAYYKSGDTLKLMVFIENEAVYKKLLEDLKYYRLDFSVQ